MRSNLNQGSESKHQPSSKGAIEDTRCKNKRTGCIYGCVTGSFVAQQQALLKQLVPITPFLLLCNSGRLFCAPAVLLSWDPVDPNVARTAEKLIVPGASVGVPSLRARTTIRGTSRVQSATSTVNLQHDSQFVLPDKSPKVQVDPCTLDDALSCMRRGFRNVPYERTGSPQKQDT